MKGHGTSRDTLVNLSFLSFFKLILLYNNSMQWSCHTLSYFFTTFFLKTHNSFKALFFLILFPSIQSTISEVLLALAQDGGKKETLSQADENKLKNATSIFNPTNPYARQLHTSVNNIWSATICRFCRKIFKEMAGKHEVNYWLFTIFFWMCFENIKWHN